MSAVAGTSSEVTQFLTGIWAAVPTPFLEDGSLDLAGVACNVRRLRDDLRLQGIFCNGLIGEQWSLTAAERMRILDVAADAAAGALQIGVVVGAATLAETLDLTRHAARAGVHHVVLMRPTWFLRDQEVDLYVRAVADASAVPVVLFDGGAQTGRFTPSLISSLVRDGVISGIKCTRGDDSAEELRAACQGRIIVTDPYECHWLANLLRFDLRVLYADPEPYLFQVPQGRLIERYFAAFGQGDLAQAARLFQQLEPLRALYRRWIMGPLQVGHPVNAVLKRWYGHMGFAAGPARAPLCPLSTADAEQFDRELKTAFRDVYGADLNIFQEEVGVWRS